jgi:hypothetical protein
MELLEEMYYRSTRTDAMDGEGMEEKGTMSCTLLYWAEFLPLHTIASPLCPVPDCPARSSCPGTPNLWAILAEPGKIRLVLRILQNTAKDIPDHHSDMKAIFLMSGLGRCY